jgi:hypothetical protein
MRLLLIIALLFTAPAYGKTIYVDRLATSGLNNGTSWDNAYTNLNQIPMSGTGLLSAGDIVEVAAGRYTSWTITRAGTVDNPIIVRVAQDPEKRYPDVQEGMVSISHINIQADYIKVSGALDEDYVVPPSVHDIDVITNNISMVSTNGTDGLHGIQIAGSGTRTGIEIKWIKFFEVGKNTNLTRNGCDLIFTYI